MKDEPFPIYDTCERCATQGNGPSRLFMVLFSLVFVPISLLVMRPFILDQLNSRGLSYVSSGLYAQAIRAYRKAILLGLKDVEAKNTLAHSYRMVGDREKTLEVYRDVLSAEPRNWNALLNLGLILGEQGRCKEAIPSLERLRSMVSGKDTLEQTGRRPSYRAAMEMLFSCYERTGNTTEARDLLAETLRY